MRNKYNKKATIIMGDIAPQQESKFDKINLLSNYKKVIDDYIENHLETPIEDLYNEILDKFDNLYLKRMINYEEFNKLCNYAKSKLYNVEDLLDEDDEEETHEFLIKYVKDQIEICKDFGCRETKSGYLSRSGIKVKIEDLYKCTSSIQIENKLHDLKNM